VAGIEGVNMTNRIKWTVLVAATILSLLVMLFLAEGAVRMRQYFQYGLTTGMESIYRNDTSVGLRVLVPNARKGRIVVNALGFRGPDIPERKPSGLVRIAFLGASTNFCAEVSGNEAVWPHMVVDEMRRRYPSVDFDYVNAGVPGYSVESSTKNYQHFVSSLQPDLVVIYHGTNDLSYEMRQLALRQGLIQDMDVDRQGWLRKYSLLWDLVVKNVRVLSAQQSAEAAQGRLSVNGSLLGKDFRQDLETLIDTVQKDRGPPAVLVTFSARIRTDQSVEDKKRAAVSALVYMPFMTLDSLVAGYARYNEVIREVAAAKHAWLIDGENDIPGDAAHFFDTVHFTDAGSKVMAERVVRGLTAEPRFAQLIAMKPRP
jgi:lysophospholipase L1-like esterase